MAAELGSHFYRFSISWPRLLPTGYSNKISEDGKRYYNELIDGLLEKGIEPLVTLYHWDLPQSLQEHAGWTNPLVVDWFASYARVAFTLYGDGVKTWITLNEPIVICDLAYHTGILAPGIVDEEFACFLCNRHVLLAHPKAWRMYDENLKPLYHGRYSHAVYSKEVGWPPSIVKIMRDISFKQGYEVSLLPEFTKAEIDLIKGTYDFFAINYYTCRIVRRAKPGERVDNFFMQGIPELRAVMEVEPGMPYGVSKFLVLCPKGLREQLAWTKEQYGDIEVFITESGFSTAGSDVKDQKRSKFIRDHLEQVLLSIKLDAVNITNVGYTYWSLLDNMEWTEGYE